MWGYPRSLTSSDLVELNANSTLAMSWRNHVQILSFASMASHQGAVKHGFVSKIAGGCSSYDVIAPWPDMTWPFFLPKVPQGLPHKVPENPAALRVAVFSVSAKNLRGVAPPCPGSSTIGTLICSSGSDSFHWALIRSTGPWFVLRGSGEN